MLNYYFRNSGRVQYTNFGTSFGRLNFHPNFHGYNIRRVQYLLLHYGYAFLILGIILEGDATLVAAVILAGDQYLSLRWVIGLAVGVSFIANEVLYELGKRGRRRHLPVSSDSRVRRWLHGHFGTATLFFSRFMWGFRLIIPCAAGAIHIRRGRFILSNFFGAIFWTAVLVYFGVAIQAGIHRLRHSLILYQSDLAVGIFLLGLGLAVGSIPFHLSRRGARDAHKGLLRENYWLEQQSAKRTTGQ